MSLTGPSEESLTVNCSLSAVLVYDESHHPVIAVLSGISVRLLNQIDCGPARINNQGLIIMINEERDIPQTAVVTCTD
jgi:hypothetical protein